MHYRIATLSLLLAAPLCLLTNAPVCAQDDDPFGKPSAGTDPFAADGNDPFAPGPGKAKPAKSAIKRAGQPARAATPGGHAGGKTAKGGKGIQVSVTDAKASEARIVSALQDETIQTFVETPLRDAVQTISRDHEIPIVIDARALEEIGLSTDVPVTLSLRNVSLRSLLRLLLRELDLTYMIKDEVLQITTVESAEQNLRTHMYRLPDQLVSKADQVLTALQASVVPDTWNVGGGPSMADAIDHVLIVSATSDVQHQVECFLNTLIESYGD